MITPVSIENDACVLGDAVGACVPLTGDPTSLGCSWSPLGCDGDPYDLDLDGQLGAFVQCGGSPPVGGSPCTYVQPGVFEPAGCGCICAGGPGEGSSTTTNGESESDTTTSGGD